MTKKMSRRLFTAGGAIAAALVGTAELLLPKPQTKAVTPVTTLTPLDPKEMDDKLLAEQTAQEILRWHKTVQPVLAPFRNVHDDLVKDYVLRAGPNNTLVLAKSNYSYDLGRQPLQIDEFLSRVRTGNYMLIRSVLENMLRALGVCSVVLLEEYQRVVDSDAPRQRLARYVTPRSTLDIDDFMKPAVAAYTLAMHARGLRNAQLYAEQQRGQLFEASTYVKREAFMLELFTYVSVVYPAAVFMQEFRVYETIGITPTR